MSASKEKACLKASFNVSNALVPIPSPSMVAERSVNPPGWMKKQGPPSYCRMYCTMRCVGETGGDTGGLTVGTGVVGGCTGTEADSGRFCETGGGGVCGWVGPSEA